MCKCVCVRVRVRVRVRVCVCVCTLSTVHHTHLAHPPNITKVSPDRGAPACCDLACGMKGLYWFSPFPGDTSLHSPGEQTDQSCYFPQ